MRVKFQRYKSKGSIQLCGAKTDQTNFDARTDRGKKKVFQLTCFHTYIPFIYIKMICPRRIRFNPDVTKVWAAKTKCV